MLSSDETIQRSKKRPGASVSREGVNQRMLDWALLSKWSNQSLVMLRLLAGACMGRKGCYRWEWLEVWMTCDLGRLCIAPARQDAFIVAMKQTLLQDRSEAAEVYTGTTRSQAYHPAAWSEQWPLLAEHPFTRKQQTLSMAIQLSSCHRPSLGKHSQSHITAAAANLPWQGHSIRETASAGMDHYTRCLSFTLWLCLKRLDSSVT